MSNRGDILSSSRSDQLVSPGQLVCVDYVRPPTSEGHNFFVRTPIRLFLDSMEIPLSQEFIYIPDEDIIFKTEVIDQARQDQVNSSVEISSSELTT